MGLSVAPVEMTPSFGRVKRKGKVDDKGKGKVKGKRKGNGKGKGNGNPPFAVRLQRMGHPSAKGKIDARLLFVEFEDFDFYKLGDGEVLEAAGFHAFDEGGVDFEDAHLDELLLRW